MGTTRLFFLLAFIIALTTGLYAQTPGDSISKTNGAQLNARDLELQKDRLLLVDATLELNEALLQGINASLDSLNIPDKPVDPKNKQEVVRKMQRSRDKALLTPELLHTQDSIQKEVVELKKQKLEIETILKASLSATIAEKNIVAIKSEPVKANAPDTTTVATTTPLKKPTKTKEDAVAKNDKHNKKHQLNTDTLLVLDVVEPVQNNTPVVIADNTPKKKKKDREDAIKPVSTKAPENIKDSSLSVLVPEQPVYTTAVALPEDEALLNLKDSEQKYFDDSINHVRAELFLIRARKSVHDKDYKEADKNIRKAIAQQDNYYDAYFDKGELDAFLGKTDSALADFNKCIQIDSSKATLYTRIGDLLAGKKVARNYYAKALQLNPKNVPALMAEAGYLNEEQKYTEAIAMYDKVLIINISYHDAYKTRGVAQLENKEYTKAVNDLTRYLLFKEDDASAYYSRGMAKVALKQKSGACLDFTTSAQLGNHAAKKARDKYCGK